MKKASNPLRYFALQNKIKTVGLFYMDSVRGSIGLGIGIGLGGSIGLGIGIGLGLVVSVLLFLRNTPPPPKTKKVEKSLVVRRKLSS